ncbi:DNA methyltransferase [Apilactobacillus micheneri]|uniref:DNA methyltransferase n=1 Tax=Apilactobacillus micheneri TaxID=1899430 RepID=UPI0011281FA8|nr:DNA methyltransferase [Apilactobacillus micheneri]TPR50452.1 DNA methyltransferase [Apilactobacillus micheneri]
MSEILFTNIDRIKNNGEVFTPKSVVDFMLNQPEIIKKINNLHSTFFEPSAGKGAFLLEILKRRIKIAMSKSDNIDEFGYNSLIALSTLYGIEYLSDNVKNLCNNMINLFIQYYKNFSINFYKNHPKNKVIKSAITIINANMVQGDTIKKVNSKGEPIVFSEWQQMKNCPYEVQRIEYTFEYIINGHYEQLNFFDIDNQCIGNQYNQVNWFDIYKESIKQNC